MDLDNAWQPSASLVHLRARAKCIRQIRNFFETRDYLEVETPIMTRYGISDVYLQNIEAYFRGKPYYLQTSPEYHMKRLLAAGSGPIFQLARVFRDDELGRWHNPEFTLLEWYQLDIDHHQLMEEVGALFEVLLNCPPLQKQTYQAVFLTYCEIDPFAATVSELKALLQRYDLHNVLPEDETDIDQYLFLLMSHVIEPSLAKINAPVAVFGFPPSQAALAQLNGGAAARFEVYYKGVELANGFHELTDAVLQAERFQADNAAREQRGIKRMEPDVYFLQALQKGIPACSGVAVGVDRLLALALNQSSLSQIMAFDFSRA